MSAPQETPPPVAVSDHDGTAVFEFLPREELYVTDRAAVFAFWELVENAHTSNHGALVLRTPRDFMASHYVDRFWERVASNPIEHTPRGMRYYPHIMGIADTTVRRIIGFLRSVKGFTIGVAEGEVDFDMLGVFLACDYRVVSSDTTFVNHSLRREVAPGTATPWFLNRLIGFRKTRELYLDERSLSASEALELGIVDRVADAEAIDSEALAVAERFKACPGDALYTLRQALDHTELDLEDYIKQWTVGFGGRV